jgi:hypothetical protein
MPSDRIVSIARLTPTELQRLAVPLSHSVPVCDDGMFDHLLAQLDRIEVEPLGRGVVMRVPHAR